MPLYEYLCEKCGKRFEVVQKFSDEPLKTHEDCGGAVERLISAPALQFKGSGWYITDYAKSGKTSGNSAGTNSGSSDKPAASKSSESSSTPAAPSTPSKSETKSST